MKYYIYLFICVLFFTSCEEVIIVDLDTDDPRLVIDAKIERINDPEAIPAISTEVLVFLSLTTSFYATIPSYVNDAEVSITNLSSGEVYNLNNVSGNGAYSLSSNLIEVEDNVEYQLIINYNGEVYESIEVLNPSVPIENLFQFKNTNSFSDPEDVTLNITYTDLPGEGNYYIFSFDNIDFLATNDEFILDGENFNFDYFYENPQEETITVYLLGSDELANNYVDSIEQLSEGGGNGPFSTVPYEVKGNIVNTINAENYPYGFFRINEVYSASIDIVTNEEAPEKPTN